MDKLLKYLQGVRSELKKVVWPKRDEVIKLTLIVFIISGIIAGYTGILDYSFTKLLEFVISR